jgi:uncharacterized protein (TIGR02597 family)
MKAPKILCAIAAIAFSLTASQAVETDPVGFVSVTASANTDSPIGLPLARASVLQTTVASVSSNVITVNSTLIASQFVYASPVQTNRYYLSVKSTLAPSSSAKGKWFEVLSNGTSTLTVDPGSTASVQSQGLTAGDSVELIPFWTLNTLFPNGQGITATTDIDFPQDLILQLPQTVAGVNLAASKSAIYSTDLVNLTSVGWYDAGTFDPVGDDIILPDTYLIFRNKGAAQSLNIVGSVPVATAKTTSIVRLSPTQRQDNFVVNPFPVAVSLPELELFESGAFQATTDIDFPKDVLFVYQGTETGFNNQPSKAYIYSTDLTNLTVAGWYDAGTFDGPFTNLNKVVPAGGALIVRKTTGPTSEVSWSANRPY